MRALFSALAALSMVASSPAFAVGFGTSATRTSLGQRLDFVASVMLEAGETVTRDCVSAQVLAGENRVASPNVRAVLEGPVDGPRRVRVTTSVVMDEPVVSIEVSIGCGSKVSRRFVTFIDPPELRLAGTAPAPETTAEATAEPRVAQGTDIVRRGERAERAARRLAANDAAPRTSRAAAAMRTRSGVADTRIAGRNTAPLRAARGAASTRTALASPAQTGGAGPRLRLDAAEPVAPRIAAAASAPLTVVASGTDPTAADEAASAAAALQAQRDLIRSLEAEVASLRKEGQARQIASQQAAAALQARVRQAETDRYANVVVYALAGVALLLALLVFALWKLRSGQHRSKRWFDAKASRLPKAAVDAPAVDPQPVAKPPVSQPAPWHAGPDSLPLHTAPATIGGLDVTMVPAPTASREHFPAVTDVITPGRAGVDLSMEELIDLEQQAEFFVVLGQDEAAAALLEHYVDSDGQSPLPYLQLLEIQHKRGDATAYELVRDAFFTRFGAAAPEWSANIASGRSLDAYPQSVARIQALWPTPLSAMEALDTMLFRRQPADEGFDFPAYRELLFLYSMARDLAGQVETDFGAIDLFLPLEGSGVTAVEVAGNELDFDVSSWQDTDIANVTPIRRAG